LGEILEEKQKKHVELIHKALYQTEVMSTGDEQSQAETWNEQNQAKP
jgi:hypothetical protein